MSINSYLEEISSKLIVKDDKKDLIKISLNAFKNRMEDYFGKYESVSLKEIKIFGSYQRDTNLPQSIDYKTDVDIMLVMNNDGATPQTYLDRVRRAVENKYSTSRIKQSSPTIVLDMMHIKFEITPAIKKNGVYKIKNSDNQWMYTYCSTDLSNLSESNKNNYYMVKPVIRLLKYWNVDKNYKSFSSYELEKVIVNYYQSYQYQGYDLKGYLLTGLKCLYSLVKYNYQKEQLYKAIHDVQEAINDEKKYPSYALKEMKEVIGEL